VQARFSGAAVQVGHVERGEALADLGSNQPPGGGAGHAQPQMAEGDQVFESGMVDDVVAGINRARGAELGKAIAVVKPGFAGEVFAKEKGVEPLRKVRQAGAVIVRACQAAGVVKGRGPVLKAKEFGHVVIGGIARFGVRHVVKLAGLFAAQSGQTGKECAHVIEKIDCHHRRRNGWVADHFAGEHLGVGGAENLIDGVEVVQRHHHFFTGFGLSVHAQ